jgi:spore maturation protein CgeB
VLLVGASHFDAVIDNYRRALEPFYEVRVFDPYASLGGLEQRLGPYLASRVNTLSSLSLRALTGEPLAAAERRLARVAREFVPDLVLVTCIHELRPAAVADLRAGSRATRVFGVYSDHLANFGRGYFFAADYDALFFKDRYVVEKLRGKLGWRHVHYLPQACDRALHRPVALDDADRARYACDLTVAGNPYLYRAEGLRPLLGRDLKVWGKPPARWMQHPVWRHFTGVYVTGDEKCKAMLAAKIVLNQVHYAEIGGTNKRTFEVAAIGAFQLTDAPASAEFFDPETEVPRFETLREMLERIEHFLARPDLRRAMAERASRRAHAEHTYEHRWAAHLEPLALRPPADFPVQPETLAVRAC